MDTESLLKLLNEHKVRYVIIGAASFPIHGYVRATLDIDLFIAPEPENARNVMAALREFGYDLGDLSLEDLLQKKILIRQYIVETDIHPFVAGVSFEEVWASRVEGLYGITPAYFSSLDALIKMKTAAGRPKDLDDLKYLTRLKKPSK